MMTEKILGRGQWKETSDKNRVVYSTFRQRKKLSTGECGTLRSATVELKVLVWVPSAPNGLFILNPRANLRQTESDVHSLDLANLVLLSNLHAKIGEVDAIMLVKVHIAIPFALYASN